MIIISSSLLRDHVIFELGTIRMRSCSDTGELLQDDLGLVHEEHRTISWEEAECLPASGHHRLD